MFPEWERQTLPFEAREQLSLCGPRRAWDGCQLRPHEQTQP